MLISYLAQRVIPIPFTNMQELYNSDYRLANNPGSSAWDSFKFGNKLLKEIYLRKMDPVPAQKQIKHLLMDAKNAAYMDLPSIM